ncbi:hypothetical protein AAFF_G00158670 [Aldrovandia affinis]|uniref:Uncharacterized protein n=1 Tax=Aldrovandia affinis TaxID=143900 RepID=A0AAD7RN29_9TELE|nr:hypothetical protein AAFF_G00158670 [Aldrovandia affinis]
MLLHRGQLESVEQLGHPLRLVQRSRPWEDHWSLRGTGCPWIHETQLHELAVVASLVAERSRSTRGGFGTQLAQDRWSSVARNVAGQWDAVVQHRVSVVPRTGEQGNLRRARHLHLEVGGNVAKEDLADVVPAPGPEQRSTRWELDGNARLP